MRRTVIGLVFIVTFVLGVILANCFFIDCYVDGLVTRLDDLERTEGGEEQRDQMLELLDYYQHNAFWAHRFVPINRIEEIEMLLFKLNAYIEAGDDKEVHATVAEVRARVKLLYSTTLNIGTS